MHSIFAGLAFILTSSQITLIKGDCGRNGYSDDTDERREMSYNPELSYKMAILSAVTHDQTHPQHCLDQYLPLTKFQLQTVVTKNCDFLDNKCSGYVAVSHSLRVLLVAFRGTESTSQLINELLETILTPPQDFLDGKVQAYFKTAFEDLWQCMEAKVKALVSKNPSYQIWVTGHSLGAALASLASASLAYYNIAPRQNIILYTFGSPRVGDYKYALQHDQLVNNSWRVVIDNDIVPHLPPLFWLPLIKYGPYHHGVEVFYSKKTLNVHSAHRECHGTPHDEDKSCSRSKSPFKNLPDSIKQHGTYFNITFGTLCEGSVSSRYTSKKTRFQFREDRCTTYMFD
ncbi:lipase ZK262.3-like [Porites lutea]|uniref:lipase ZK262.3-like n=1 Tax=Porites lutea TaxID=51062 RepID=UPI003CC681D2